MTRIILVAWMLTAIPVGAAAQPARDAPPPRPDATVAGQVFADDTNDPLRNVRVALAGGVSAPRVVLSDAEGRFTISAPTGRYTISAKKTGYAPADITASAPAASLHIRLTRGAIVSGRVVDEFGEPVMGARVTVDTRSGSGSRSIAATETDDRGEYRVSSLPAGAVVVGVSTMGPPAPVRIGTGADVAIMRTPLRMFYPSAQTQADAEPIVVTPGVERSRIDFRVPTEPLPFLLIALARAERATIAGGAVSTPAGTATVRGRIVSTEGRPLPHAMVQLISATDPMQSRADRTDESGQFEFRDLASGAYTIGGSKTGFSPAPADGVPSAARPAISGSRVIRLSAGEAMDRVEIRLAPWGSIEGHVLDEYGDPVEGARVQVLALRYEAGRRRLVPAAGSAAPTDDLGRYRVFGVAPGRYVISATAAAVLSAELPNYARSYYPGTSEAVAAQFVSVGVSDTVSARDFPLVRVKTVRVAGTLLNAAGEPTVVGALTLIPSYRASVSSIPVGARISKDGAFEFPNVAPGQYIIQASRGRTNAWTEGEFAALPVTVTGAGDVTGLVLHASAGSTIAGRFTFDTADRSKLPAPGRVELSAIAVDPELSPTQTASANVHDDWTFEMTGINGPRRLQLMRAPAEWALKEIRVRGFDVTDRPLPFGTKTQSVTDVEVVLTDRVSTVMGAVSDSDGRPVVPGYVLVVSTDRSRWYPKSRFMRTTAIGTGGAYSLSGLPFGSYYVVAAERLPDDGDDGWQDPDFLEPLLSVASTVTIAEGDRQVVNLRLKGR
jgi:protocatechuate 3,4-dioxygenase beta subunit